MKQIVKNRVTYKIHNLAINSNKDLAPCVKKFNKYTLKNLTQLRKQYWAVFKSAELGVKFNETKGSKHKIGKSYLKNVHSIYFLIWNLQYMVIQVKRRTRLQDSQIKSTAHEFLALMLLTSVLRVQPCYLIYHNHFNSQNCLSSNVNP